MLFNHEKVDFLHLPTPLEYLPNISKDLGVEFYIKRDDLTGLGMGGNKLRKLEYLLKDAQDQEATMLLTVGGAQTNHGRLTAAIAAKYGMKCAIIAIDEYPGEISANLLLDRIMGAAVILKKPAPDIPELKQFEETVAAMQQLYEKEGENVYYIPMGGSNELGVLGYYECALELASQASEMGITAPRVIVPVGSMGTYMGLFSAIKNEKLPMSLTGITVMPYDMDIISYAAGYHEKVKAFHGMKGRTRKKDLDIRTEYDLGGYNEPDEKINKAIYQMARREGIILDPCYTGKVFAGICSMVQEGKIRQGEKIIFIHTGGQPAINGPEHRIAMEKDLLDGVTIL